MNTGTKIIIAIVAIAAVVLGFKYWGSKPAYNKTTSTPAESTSTSGGYTLADVSKHNDQTSCWSVINGNVYDLTNWISQHPGGEGAILSICGKDGSSAFNNQHGDQGRPNNILANFEIGILLK